MSARKVIIEELIFQAFCIAMLKTCDTIKTIVNRAQVFEEVSRAVFLNVVVILITKPVNNFFLHACQMSGQEQCLT